jgi:hypothetical protein
MRCEAKCGPQEKRIASSPLYIYATDDARFEAFQIAAYVVSITLR